MRINNLTPQHAAPVKRENLTTISDLINAVNASQAPQEMNCDGGKYSIGRGLILCRIWARILYTWNPMASDDAE